MAVKHRCKNPTCNKLTLVKYWYCDACRAKGITKYSQANLNDTVVDASSVEKDRQKLQDKSAHSILQRKYREALDVIERLESELGVVKELSDHFETFSIEPTTGSGTSEATPVVVASDWHYEEHVDPRTVNGLNEHTLDIAGDRAQKFFQHGLRLIRLLNQDVTINTVVLGLLGDFISNDIHEEIAEVASVPPTNAIVLVQNAIASGIEFWLEHTKYNLVIVCKSGNHGRTTKTTRFATENGHSLEYLMYLHLATYFRSEPRVKFIIEDGIHTYLNIYDQTLRFHHGHAIRYAGGVGGITIPVNKAIAQWDKAKPADLDVFGHFHQLTIAKKFVCNGSQIGYNAFASSIKAEYEPPQQALFLIDKRRGRTCTWPILYAK